MNGQENRTCRVVAFVSIDRNAFVIRWEAPSRSLVFAASTNGERGAKGGEGVDGEEDRR